MIKKLKSVAYLLIGIFTFQLSFLSVGSAQEFMLPSDVENLRAEAKDGVVKLLWDKASDSDGVILGYKIYYGTNSVKDIDDEYADEILTGSSDLSYEISNLINGVQYYFSLTALDDEENESENYSIEVSAMPVSATTDNPSVISAEQKSFTEIEVLMSKEVTVKSLTSSFSIKEKLNPTNYLDIENTKLNGKKVMLVIADGFLKPAVHYVVTATSTVEDYFGNPVSSGITDSVVFVSKSEAVMEAMLKSKEPAEVVLEDYVFPSDEEVLFIEEEVSVEVDFASPTASEIIIEKESETDLEVIHNTAFEQDKTPPLGVQKVILDSSTLEQSGFVSINWNPALDVDGDIVDQIIYTKEEGGEWDDGYSVGKETSSIELEVDENTNYEVKIVTLDSSSNQTDGEVLAFSTKLMQTGSGTVISFMMAFILSGLYFVSRRRVC